MVHFIHSLLRVILIHAVLLGVSTAANAGNWVETPWNDVSCSGTTKVRPGLYSQTCVSASKLYSTAHILVYFRNTGTSSHYIGVPESYMFAQRSNGALGPFEKITNLRYSGGCPTTAIQPGAFKNCVAVVVTGLSDIGWLVRNISGNARIAADGAYIGWFGSPNLYPR